MMKVPLLLLLTALFFQYGFAARDRKLVARDRKLSVIANVVDPKPGNPQPVPAGGGGGTFNVKDHGARGDGKTNDCQALEAAWKAACECPGNPKVWVPVGTYLSGPLVFAGPCAAQTITFQLEGTLLASTELSQFTVDHWIRFGPVNGLTVTGGGTFDGQGAATYNQNKCPTKKDCKPLPSNVKFQAVTNGTMTGIKSVNPKFFHFGIVGCERVEFSKLTITAPPDSPNTDGMHIERCIDCHLRDSVISTGDDCVSLGAGNTRVTVTGITCGPGHGISVGSLGRYPTETDVTGLLVKNCTMIGTMFGARIKTWENSVVATTASNITFEDLQMKDVGNPIMVDQTYCPFANCADQPPSRVKLQDITFRNIRGTATLPEAITLECSKTVPCSNVIVENVHLEPKTGTNITSVCMNSQHKFIATTLPAPCPPK